MVRIDSRNKRIDPSLISNIINRIGDKENPRMATRVLLSLFKQWQFQNNEGIKYYSLNEHA